MSDVPALPAIPDQPDEPDLESRPGEDWLQPFTAQQQERIQNLVNGIAGRSITLDLGGVPGQDDAPQRRAAATRKVRDLLSTCQRLMPAHLRQDPDGVIATLEALTHAHIDGPGLEDLVRKGATRDAWRALAVAELTYFMSFFLAGLVSLNADTFQAHDPQAFGPQAAALVADQNFALQFGLASLLIGLGGELAGNWAKAGSMGPRYLQFLDADGKSAFAPGPAGRRTQYASAWPFGLLYALDQAGRRYLGLPAWTRLLAGAVAASVAQLHRTAIPRALGVPRQAAWLDASSEDKASAMAETIQGLRRNCCEAVGDYLVTHVAGGLRKSVGWPADAWRSVSRVLVRTVVAGLTRAGNPLVYAMHQGRHLGWVMGAEAWTGASWGYLSTAPDRASQSPSTVKVSPAAVTPRAAPTPDSPPPGPPPGPPPA